MRPKPSREWVMLELERLQVRVVSGRLGRRGSGNGSDEDIDDDGLGPKGPGGNSQAIKVENVLDRGLVGAGGQISQTSNDALA
eukprot:199825-Ditylum_brightwellii.AAC.1